MPISVNAEQVGEPADRRPLVLAPDQRDGRPAEERQQRDRQDAPPVGLMATSDERPSHQQHEHGHRGQQARPAEQPLEREGGGGEPDADRREGLGQPRRRADLTHERHPVAGVAHAGVALPGRCWFWPRFDAGADREDHQQGESDLDEQAALGEAVHDQHDHDQDRQQADRLAAGARRGRGHGSTSGRASRAPGRRRPPGRRCRAAGRCRSRRCGPGGRSRP